MTEDEIANENNKIKGVSSSNLYIVQDNDLFKDMNEQIKKTKETSDADVAGWDEEELDINIINS